MARLDSALRSSVSGTPFAWKPSRRTTFTQPVSGPATLVQTQAMNQDYQQVMIPAVSNLMGPAFVAFQHFPQRAKVTELVTVSNEAGYENGLIWFHPDSGSHSGWAHESSTIYSAPQQYGEPMVPSMLLPFYQGDTLVVFAEYDTPGSGTSALLGMQRTPQNGWEQVLVPEPLYETLQNMAQSALFYGPDGQGYLYGVDWSDPKVPEFVILGLVNGSLANLYSFPAVAGASYKLLPGPQAGDFVALQLEGSVATFQAGTIQDGSVNPVGSPASQDLGVGDLAADTVVPIIGGVSGQPAFLLLAQNQQLYLVTGNGLTGSPPATPKAVQITGGTNQPASLLTVTGGSQPDGSGFTAFALDVDSNQLWMLAPPGPGDDYAWVPMGNIGIAIATPALMAGGPELFLCDPATMVSHITQRADTGSWFTLPIATPSPSTHPINETSSFTQQFTLNSAAGVPMGNEVLSVTASPAQVLVVNNIAYNASPSQPAIIRTNGAGSVVIASAATGLASPVLTVKGAALQNNAPGDPPPPSYRGDTQLHQRIAAQGGFSYNGQDLINGGVLPANTSSSDADQLASNLQQTSGVAVNIANGGSGDAARPKTAFIMKIEGKRLHSRVLTPEEFANISGGYTDSVFTKGWGDFAHFCKQAWSDIEHIAIEIADTTATIAVKLADATEQFVLTTIDDIRDALEVMLQFCVQLWDAMVNVIKLFIEFIKLLFDWGNILNTKNVLRYTVEQLLQDLQKSDSGAMQWIDGQFDWLENTINDAFNNLESVIDPNLSFGGASQGSAPVQQQQQANAVQNNYIMSKAVSPMPALDAPVQGTFDPQTAWVAVTTSFKTAFQNSEKELETSFDQILDFMSEVDSLSSFLDLAILGFLEACQDMAYIVVQAIEAVVNAVLELMAGVAEYISSLLLRTIDIPVLSALYKLISGGDPMTLLDLVCLAVAVPATMAYEIVHDAPPFSSQWMAQFESPNKPPPILWPWSQDFSGETAGPRAVHPMLLSKGHTPVEFLAAATAGCYGVCDLIADGSNLGEGNTDKEWLKVVSGIGLGLGLLALAFGQPWYAPKPSGSPAAGMEMGTFGFGLVPWVIDAVFYAGDRKLSRFATAADIGNYGVGMSCLCGMVQIAAGAATWVMMATGKTAGDYQYSLPDEIAGVLSGVSNLGKPFVKMDVPGILFTMVMDLIGDGGSLIVDIFADTK